MKPASLQSMQSLLHALSGLGIALLFSGFVSAQSLDFRSAADYSAANRGDAVVVMQNGRVVFEEYQNGYLSSTPHLLASGSKSFSCAIAIKAQQEGLIDLDEPVSNVIHSWRLNSANPAPQVEWKAQITARHLLSLASGLSADGEFGTLFPSVDMYRQALTVRSEYAPNQAAIYSSNTFAAFAAYFQLKTDGTLNEDGSVSGGTDPFNYLRQKIFVPLGITTATITRDPRGQPHLAGGMFMTAGDWLRYGQMISQGGVWNGVRLLDENRLRECITYNNPTIASYGLTWWTNRPAGSTYNAAIDQLPPAISGSTSNQFARDAPLDTFMAAGALNQRLYIIPSLSLVVLRFASGGLWSDNEFLKRLLNGQKPAAPQVDYQDLWWAGSAENGWGMSITQKGDVMFNVLYVYDGSGRPQWLVMPGGTWNATYSSYGGPLYRPSGAPFSEYDASRLLVGAPVGNATLDFRDGANGTLRYSIDGVSGSKRIVRQFFSPGPARGNYTDLWWGGPAQNGWGLALTQQGSQIFGVWYTYDSAGRVTWLVMPGGTFSSANNFSGALYRTQSSPWLGATYDPARLSVLPVGTLTFTFTDANSGTMRYSVDGVSGVNSIFRQPF